MSEEKKKADKAAEQDVEQQEDLLSTPQTPSAPGMGFQTLSYGAIVRAQFKRSWINRIAFAFVVLLAAVALLAPFLANGVPIYMKRDSKIYFPLLKTVWPISEFNIYPELKDVDYKLAEKEGAEVRYTLVPYSPNDYDLNSTLSAPDEYHALGTDALGRDVACRMIWGARISISVGLVAVGIYTLLGILFGSLAGYFGGFIDWMLSRGIEVMICFPTFFLILTLMAVVKKPSVFHIMLVIGLTGWTGIARLVRAEFLKLRDQDFVVACRSQGMKTGRIIWRHVLPNAMAPVLVSATFGIASAVLIESSLSFLGFGVQPPTPSWGDILSGAREYITTAWWLTVFPGAAIFLTVMSYNLSGEGLRDAIDPKLRRG